MGDLEIRSGGVVAIDTASLRSAADRLDLCAADLDELSGLFRRACDRIDAVPRAELIGGPGRAWTLHVRAAALAESPRRVARDLRDAAAVFELVELRAQRASVEATGDLEAMARIDARIDELDRAYPYSDLRANWDRLARVGSWSSDVIAPFAPIAGGLLGIAAGGIGGLALWAALASVRGQGAGTIESGSRMTGASPMVRVHAHTPATATSGPPQTLAAAATRIATSDGRLRVERYTMPDGTRQFAVYIPGTNTDGAPSDPFDAESNLELYTGQRSASYEATLAALRAAGAEPGDVVHAFGHSQGAMIASRLAVEGGYDAQTLVTFGSPVEAEVGADTLSVAVRHTDDPVAALSGGGHDGGVGATGSFVAERSVDVTLSVFTPDPLQAHHLEAYEETAALLDGSDDPRMDAVRERLGQLGAASSVEVTEYSAERVSPGAEDAGRCLPPS